VVGVLSDRNAVRSSAILKSFCSSCVFWQPFRCESQYCFFSEKKLLQVCKDSLCGQLIDFTSVSAQLRVHTDERPQV